MCQICFAGLGLAQQGIVAENHMLQSKVLQRMERRKESQDKVVA
jgi:hypothetical protein